MDSLKATQTLEGENTKLKSEMNELRAEIRKSQSDPYCAGFLGYLRNFLAGDPEYDWVTHFAPSTPAYMQKFKDENAQAINEANKFEVGDEGDNAEVTSPSTTVVT